MFRLTLAVALGWLLVLPGELAAAPTTSRIYGRPRKRPRKRPDPKRPRRRAAKPGKARPGAKPGKARPGATPPKARPGAKPGKARPGAKPGKARPGATPPKARPGATPGKVRPGAQPGPKRPRKRRLMPWGRPPGVRVPPRPGGKGPGPARATGPVRPGLRAIPMDPSKAPGIGYTIVGVRVIGNKKTARGCVLLNARVPLGNPFTLKVRDEIRRNLLATPFCKSVVVNWEVHKTKPNSVVLFLSIKERITWIISPSFSYSDGNYGGSMLFKEKNLLGSGKLLRIFAGYNNEAQRLTVQYKDPNIMFSPVMWAIDVDYQRWNLKEYDPSPAGIRNGSLLRAQTFQQFMTGLAFGYFWFNWVQTHIKYQFALVDFAIPRCVRSNPSSKLSLQRCPESSLAVDPADIDTTIGRSYYVGPMALLDDHGIWRDTIDQRGKFWNWKRDARIQLKAAVVRNQVIMGMERGFVVRWLIDIASKNLGGEFDYVTWSLTYTHGFNFAKSREFGARHNLTLFAEQAATHNAPYFRELRLGGADLRGYASQQLAGDTMTRFRVQYKVHMFTLGWFMFRAVAFYDTAWIFFRKGGHHETQMHEKDGLRRYYLPEAAGPKSRTLWNNGIGAGLRINIKPLSMGSIGFDVAYGIEARTVRFIVMIGT